MDELDKLEKGKPCKWCKKDKRTYWDHDPDGEGVQVGISPENGELSITSNELCSDINCTIPIKYCPMCGRRL